MYLLIGGFRSSRIRALVWPKLLDIDSNELSIHYRTFLHSQKTTTSAENETEALDHRDLQQVRVDVERSLYSIYQVKHWTDEQRNERRNVLTDIIIAVLTKNEDKFYYYQVYKVWATYFTHRPLVLKTPYFDWPHSLIHTYTHTCIHTYHIYVIVSSAILIGYRGFMTLSPSSYSWRRTTTWRSP